MADPFVAEIRIFPFNFAPRGWAMCDGQLLPLSQNTALFSLLRTTYGGNGESNFALPDLRGRAPMHPGQGPGLSPRTLGEQLGLAAVELSESEIPSHSHAVHAADQVAEDNDPSPSALPAIAVGGAAYASGAAGATLGAQALAPAGGSMPHNNMQPYLTFNFCIALQGVFPPRE